MFDLKWIRENPDVFDRGLGRRGLKGHAATIGEMDGRRRAVIAETQQLQHRRNEASKAVGQAKRNGENADALIEEVSMLKERLQEGEETEKAVAAEINALVETLPNLPDEDVPDGGDETDNVEVRRIGQPRRFDFAPREHFDIGEALGTMDFESATRMSGARFVTLTGSLARLERAIAAFMLDLQTQEHGYTEVSPPYMVRDHGLYGTGQLPKFSEDLFRSGDLWLIPTAEVPLTNLVREQILASEDLPIRVTAYTPCFRAEAGAAGRDTRGMIRLHQFSKVELVSIVHPESSDDELERMTRCAETVLQRLELPFRVMTLCAGDMGFSAAKTYDLEVWLPGQGVYREISSCSNCRDFQARRAHARFRPEGQKGTRFVHTLNGSGLAVGRTMVAILENYQNEDGSVTIPDALRSYMGGIDRLTAA